MKNGLLWNAIKLFLVLTVMIAAAVVFSDFLTNGS
jgi:hypothetical protein